MNKHIEKNKEKIQSNRENIKENKENIKDNQKNISENKKTISENKTAIEHLQKNTVPFIVYESALTRSDRIIRRLIIGLIAVTVVPEILQRFHDN